MEIKPHYSAEVRLYLVAGNRTWKLAKLGPGEFTPRAPIDLQPCDGTIIMTVDGEERQWNVRLTNGATPRDSAIRFEFASS